MATRKLSSGIKPKWPSSDAHLSTGSDSDVKLTVDSNLQLSKQSPSATTKKSPPKPQVQQRQQGAPPVSKPRKDVTFDNWNPMDEDYNDKSFNSYNRGPAAGISGTNASRSGKKGGKFTLFVGNIPTEMTEEGVSNLFSHVCDIQHVAVCRPRDENSDTTFGFVEVPSIKDGEEAIKRLDGHIVRNRHLKVSFKREKQAAPVEVPHVKSDSPEEWDPPNPGGKPMKMMKSSAPSGKRRSTSSGKTSSSNSEAEDGGGRAVRKPAQPRKLEDRYGTSLKPRTSGDESATKSPTRGQPMSPREAQGDNQLAQSSLQALLQKMRSPNKSSPEPDSTPPEGQKLRGVKSSPEVKGQAGRGIGREIDFEKLGEAAPCSSMKQSLAEKLQQAGIFPKSRALDGTHPNANSNDKIEREGLESHPAASKTAPLSHTYKSVEKQPPEFAAGLETDLQEKGEGDNSSRNQVPKHNPHKGILGPAPGHGSQPHGPAQESIPSHCLECSAHECHSCQHHHRPPSHHHHQRHQSPRPRNGPCPCCEGYPAEDEPYPVYHRRPEPLMYPPFPQGPAPRFGPVPPYSAYNPCPRGRAQPSGYQWHGSYDNRDPYQMRYPGNLRSAGNRNARFGGGRPRHPLSSFPHKSPKASGDGPGDQTKQPPKPTPEPDKIPTGKGTADESKEPEVKASPAKVGEPAAGNQGLLTSKTLSPKNTAPEPSYKVSPSVLPNPEGDDPAIGLKTPAEKSTAIGEGQRSLHKETKTGQRGPIDPKPCVHCGTPGLLRCSKCKCTYCSKECQKEDWPSHKDQCRKVNGSKGSSTASSIASVDSFQTKAPEKSAELLHGGMEGQFMARNLPFETPESPEMKVLVTEVVDPSEVWVQLVQERSMEGFSKVDEMLRSVYTDPAQATQLSYKAMVGGVCAVQYSQDSHWYRAEVVSIDKTTCNVRLIDFGNMDIVAVNSLRRLQDSMLKLPKQALKCFLSDVKPLQGTWPPDATEMLKSLVNKDESCTRAKFRGQGARGQEIELYSAEDHTKTLSSILMEAGLAESASSTITTPPTSGPVMVTPDPTPTPGWVLDDLAEGSHLDVIVSHVDSPSCFYAYLFESARALLDLQQQMKAHYDEIPFTFFRPGLDELCAAKYSEDDNWYRAITVTQACPPLNRLQVTFIDHGNSERVYLNDCRPLEAKFTSLPRQAIPCGLASVRHDGSDWPEEMTAAFKEWLADDLARVEVKAKSSQQLQVEIFQAHRNDDSSTNISFNALLKHSGFGAVEKVSETKKPDDSVSSNEKPVVKAAVADGTRRDLPVTDPPQTEFHGYVTVVNDPSDFFLQVYNEENMEAFRSLSEHLNTRYALQDFTPYKPHIGEYCAVIYSDNAWYRALVVDKMAPESFKVLLVDYGEVGVLPADKIRQLEDRFYKQPPMALHCSLTCVVAPSSAPTTSWNVAATKHFTEKALNQLCQVSVVKSENSKWDVELLYPGKDMNKLTSVKRDLIQRYWAVPKGTPASNQTHGSGSGNHWVANPDAATKANPHVNRSPTPPPNIPTVPHLPSANPSVCSLPALKVPTEDFLGVVTVVSDHGDVYIQVMTKENAEAMEALTLDEHYNRAPLSPFKAKVGEFCAVKYRLDNTWCRGQVVSCSLQDSAMQVQFVDFGNIETVSPEDIVKLDEKFLMIPTCALRCRLSGIRAPSAGGVWQSAAIDFLRTKILEKEVQVHICKNDGKIYEVELLYSTENSWFSINKALIHKGLVEPITVQSHSPGPSGDHPSTNQKQLNINHPALSANESKHQTQPQTEYTAARNSTGGVQEASANGSGDMGSGGQVEMAPANKLPDGEPPPAEFTGVLTAVNHPCDFYLQIKNDDYIQLLLLLREELNKQYPLKEERPHMPRVGQLCAAMYSADEEWYRALALVEVAPKQAFKVMFVDYGNCEVVPVDRLQPLEGIFLDVPRLCHHCSLSGVLAPPGDDHRRQSAGAASFILTELIDKGKDCHIKLVKHDGKMSVVELHYSSDDGTQHYNLKEELLRHGLAKPVAVATSPIKENHILARNLQKATLPTGAEVVVTVTDVVSPQEFYCQMIILEEIDKLKSLMEDMAVSAGNLRLRAPPAIGDLCLAKFTEDDVWYRAEIIKINQAKQRALVYYVDFGNKEPLPWSRLVTADSKFTGLPMQAIRCGLQGVSPNLAADEQTRLSLSDLIRERTNQKRMLARGCGTSADGTTSLVTLIDEDSGMDIGWLINDHAAAVTSPRQTTKSRLPISATFSPVSQVVSPQAATPDPARLEAQKREIERKKKQLEEQIEARRRELEEMEQLKASLEQGL